MKLLILVNYSIVFFLAMISNFINNEQKFGDAVYVEYFGAKGDGLADDTQAVQRAINSNYSRILFKEKSYVINGEISLKSNKQYSGKDTKFVRTIRNGGDSFFCGKNLENVKVSGISFFGNVSKGLKDYKPTAACIRITDSKNISLSDLSVFGGTSGIQIYYSDSITIKNVTAKNNLLTGISGIANNILLDSLKLSENGYISKGLTHDLYFMNSSNLILQNSVLGRHNDSVSYSAVFRYDLSDSKVGYDEMENVKIINNSFYKNGLSIGSDPGVNVNLRMPPKNIVVIGNNFNGSNLKFDDPQNCSSSNNVNIGLYICRVASRYPGYLIGLLSENDQCETISQSSLGFNIPESLKNIIFSSMKISNADNPIVNSPGFGGRSAFTLRSSTIGNKIVRSNYNNKNIIIK